MKQSHLFTRTRKEAPKDEVAKNAQLLIRAGFINKEMAGVYSYLPLGLRVFKKIENIIREEMNALGGQEVVLSSFHPKENWVATGRWTSMDDLYKVADSSGREVALGPTHEEIIVPILKQFVSSYKDLPQAAYQFQNKFRMELRAKSGILRGREFVMKDLYSFHADEADFEKFYEAAKESYVRIFEKVGIGHLTYVTFASGGTFAKYSHEFQAITDAGEDIIYYDKDKRIAVNKEVYEDEILKNLGLDKGSLVEAKSIEVGNIFSLKTKYSDPFSLAYTDATGTVHPVLMGCYGIGLGRLMGTVVEILADEKGLVWPKSIAPFDLHLLPLGEPGSAAYKEAESLKAELEKEGFEVLMDDRDARPGEKFADADLIGIPLRAVISAQSLEKGGIELKGRTDKDARIVSKEELLTQLRS
ncbi:prolyl-tRNA synthetase [Candidatus Parcubacteria bacterium]|nr:prolyl-tRNA synthetase [Candidatus Parcubacteria bacterium]